MTAFLIALFEAVIRTDLDFEHSWLAPLAPAPTPFAVVIFGPIAEAFDLKRRKSAAR